MGWEELCGSIFPSSREQSSHLILRDPVILNRFRMSGLEPGRLIGPICSDIPRLRGQEGHCASHTLNGGVPEMGASKQLSCVPSDAGCRGWQLPTVRAGQAWVGVWPHGAESSSGWSRGEGLHLRTHMPPALSVLPADAGDSRALQTACPPVQA